MMQQYISAPGLHRPAVVHISTATNARAMRQPQTQVSVRMTMSSNEADVKNWRVGAGMRARACAGVILRSLLPTPLRIQVVHHMSHGVSVCVRSNCSNRPKPHAASSEGPIWRPDTDHVPQLCASE